MKVDILSVAGMYGPSMERLEREFNVHKLTSAPDRAKLIAEVGPRIRGIQGSGSAPVEGTLIGALPKLEIISCFGVGYDGVDLASARKRNIIVTNTPDVLNDCVADLAIGLLLAASRGIAWGDRYVRAGKWLGGAMPLQTKVSGKRLGIVGMGRIGRTIAKRLSGFDMQIAYHTRRSQSDLPFRYYEKLVDLAKDSDFLVLIVPGGKETFHMVNEEVLRALGPKGILVNVARGSVVDEKALVDCLQEGALGGAGLDVFEDEPRMPEALWKMDNVALTPHVASATHETRAAMGKLCIDNLVEHFAGRPVLTPVP
ncbi:MAG TPA: 2-hydroxyacid dehydrogenase [Burkholderiales bacterium]|nr:2-hydroxyacid dehydrogenase [Burkholderiales bacterium]